MSNDDKISQLEIAHLREQQDRTSRSEVPFKDYIDSRFENTLDVIKRASLGFFRNQLIGDGDEITGIVLRSTVVSTGDTEYTGLRGWFERMLGEPVDQIGLARVQVLGKLHTDLYESPLTYDQTARDIIKINNFPQFKYSVDDLGGELMPGHYVRGRFDQGTLRTGIITRRLDRAPVALPAAEEPTSNRSFERDPAATGGQTTQTTSGTSPASSLFPATTYSEDGQNYPAGIYKPDSAELTALLLAALEYSGLDTGWALLDSTHYIISQESGGKVGVPNYTYDELLGRDPFYVNNIKKKPDYWPEVWDHARQGIPGVYNGRSSATGLGQLLSGMSDDGINFRANIPQNVQLFYPDGVNGISDPLNEAVGYVQYIRDRYGDPDTAKSMYGRTGTYTNTATGEPYDKDFKEGY